MARWSSKLNLLLTATDSVSRPVRGATNSITGFGRAANRSTQQLRQFGLQTGRLVADMQGFANALNITSAGAIGVAARLDRATTMLVAQVGGSRREIDNLQHSILSLTATTGSSVTTVTQLASSLGESGQAIDENAESLVRLVDTWGLSTQSAAELNKTTKMLGLTLDGLLDTTAGYQKQFGITGMVSSLPTAMNFAIKSMSQFSRSVVRDEKSVIDSTMKTGAILAKTFGRPFQDGLRQAEAHYTQFSDALENTRNVFLGLEDSFSPMQNALFEAGMGIDQITGLLKQGRDEPIEFAKNISKIYHQLQETASPWYAERFLQNIKRTSSEVVRGYLSDSKLIDEAERQRAAAIDAGGANWADTTKAMRDNAETGMEIFHNFLDLAKVVVGSTFLDVIREVFGGKAVNETFKDLNVWLIKTSQAFKESDIYEKGLKPILVAIGKGIVYFSTFSGLLVPLAGGLGIVGDAVKFILKPLDMAAKGVDAVSGFVGGLADSLGNASLTLAGFSLAIPGLNFLLTPLFGIMGVGLKAVGAGFGGLGDVGVKNLTIIGAAMERIGAYIEGDWKPTLKGAIAGVGGAFEDAAELIDDSLGGLPSKIMNYFSPPPAEWVNKKFKDTVVVMGKTIGKEANQLYFFNKANKQWQVAEYTLKDRFAYLGERTREYLQEWDQKGFIPATTDLFKSLGKSLDEALKGAPTQIMNAIFPDDKKPFEERASNFGGWLAKKLKFWTDIDAVEKWFGEQLDTVIAWLQQDSTQAKIKVWGRHIGTAVGAGIDLIKSIFPEDGKKTILSRFGEIGEEIGKGIMKGIGAAFTARAFIEAAPDFFDFVVRPVLYLADKEAYERVSTIAREIKTKHEESKAAQDNKKFQAASSSPSAATIGPVDIKRVAGGVMTAQSKFSAVEAVLNQQIQEESGFFGDKNKVDWAKKQLVLIARYRQAIKDNEALGPGYEAVTGKSATAGEYATNRLRAISAARNASMEKSKYAFNPEEMKKYLDIEKGNAAWLDTAYDEMSAVLVKEAESNRQLLGSKGFSAYAEKDPAGAESWKSKIAERNKLLVSASERLHTMKGTGAFMNQGEDVESQLADIFAPKSNAALFGFRKTIEQMQAQTPEAKPTPARPSPAGTFANPVTLPQGVMPTGMSKPVNVNVIMSGKDGAPLWQWVDVAVSEEAQNALGKAGH